MNDNATATPAQLAKAALRRLALQQQEPTPDNYARAYAAEGGKTGPEVRETAAEPGRDAGRDTGRDTGREWAELLERLVRQVDRASRQWTAARRKDSLKRVLDGSRSDPQRLLQRLQGLVRAWDGEPSEDPEVPALASEPAGAWPQVSSALHGALAGALPQPPEDGAEIAAQLAVQADGLAAEGASPERVAAIVALCERARPLLHQRRQLVEGLVALCREFGEGLVDWAEEPAWAEAQQRSLEATLGAETTPTARAVRAARLQLQQARREQAGLRERRLAAREALRGMLEEMLAELSELSAHTGRFELATASHAERIAAVGSVADLAPLVAALLQDVRHVHGAVSRSHARLSDGQARAQALEAQVRELESELRRLADEVATDALTQVANRRGLEQAFGAESARALRSGAVLAVGLIDIDNFKKLNDGLGHAAGDQALKALAQAVRERLRPGDHLARFGGEEFVVLLPGTDAEAARQSLTRLQRSLTEALFLHEGREVFVTFSAGVTAWRAGEALETALERADAGLYEAKRSGKNRTCAA